MVDCSLCYTPFGSGSVYSEAHAFRGCGHVFCHGCIAQLTQIGCPVCRWKPPNEYAYASNLSSAVVLRLFIDFSEANTLNTLQTRLEDTEKKLAAAKLEMVRFKEKVRMEKKRLQRKWKDEADNLKAELEQANGDVEYLARRLENERPRSAKEIAALVSEGVKTACRAVAFVFRAIAFIICRTVAFICHAVAFILALGFVLALFVFLVGLLVALLGDPALQNDKV